MIDPGRRWKDVGLLTFAGLPYTEDPAELAGAKAVIVRELLTGIAMRRRG